MSTFDADDLETTGYFLPEDSQHRLKKLREYVGFLANLARPRMADESRECIAEIRPGEVAICLELLEEQIGQVLDEVAWPAERGDGAAVREADAEAEALEPEVAGPVMDEAGSRYVFGITLGQIDEINRLIDSIRAQGDVAAAHDDAKKLREIMLDVSAQRLGPARDSRTVREERATYHALPARLLMGGASRVTRQLPTVRAGRALAQSSGAFGGSHPGCFRVRLGGQGRRCRVQRHRPDADFGHADLRVR